MKVILLQDVKGLGKAGQVAKVSDGYARNLLIPKGLVKEATDGNLREMERQAAINEAKQEKELGEAKEKGEAISRIEVKIRTKGGEGGRLFGSITAKDIADELAKQHGIEIDKRKFSITNPIKHTGEHIVDIKLHAEVTAKLRVIVEV
ncbi:MAG: 50S ribosomal protein L9 [Firmicutes bacterium HGW-Firmicutes-11]|jgi:large subunit ribosomal protein L9|nr:MAG: 50S ribosomal protein L9 [Firmicutes bacterium HGW-Firmicutes-11]